ncbi:hypothetical protein CRE_30574 [Caenorhabditis remanei]|uniref:Uncharacterized protein n=1 Tax=Caenorhabditis remanei TaxID=31234 RepID=E3NPS7_CAERE|nr:hypothetical protein CRE_30574 [Caenorhabditis remanei]
MATKSATTATAATTTTPTEINGSKSKRRRYFANGRSRTIELSTLAEIDEEEFAKAEGASSQPEGTQKVLITQDDMCIGTTGGSYKSLKRGSVKAQALKLSERLAQKVAADNLAKEREEKSEMEKQSCSKPIVVDVKLRRNLTEIRRDIRNFEVVYLLPYDHYLFSFSVASSPPNDDSFHCCSKLPALFFIHLFYCRIRVFALILPDMASTYSYAEFNKIFNETVPKTDHLPVVVRVIFKSHQVQIYLLQTTTDFSTSQDWPQQQQHEFQPNCSIPMQRHPISRSASFVAPTPLIVYGMPPQHGDRMSMIDGRCDSRIGEYAMPLYYMPAPPPPQPMFLPYPGASKMGMTHFDQPSMVMMPGHPLQYPEMQMRRKMKSVDPHRRKSWCSRICCAGFAQLLWTIVCIISFGIIASLILALCYM